MADILRSRLEINWSKDEVTWEDESDQFEAAAGSITIDGEIPAFVGAAAASDMTLLLANAAYVYSPDNTAGAHYASIQNDGWRDMPVRLKVTLDGTDPNVYGTVIFQGYVAEFKESLPEGMIELRLLDNSDKLSRDKVDTALYENQRTDEWILQMAYEAGLTTSPGGGQGWVTRTVGSGGDQISYKVFLTDDVLLERGTAFLRWAWADDEDPWSEMARAAEAEGGRVFFGPDTGGDGSWKLQFHNGFHDARGNVEAVAETYTVDSFEELVRVKEFEDLYDKVEITYAPFIMGPQVVVYDMEEIWEIPPATTKEFEIRFRQPVGVGELYEPVYRAEKIDRCDYIAVTGRGSNISTSITFPARTDYAQSTTFQVANAHTEQTAYMVRFQIRGRGLVGTPDRKYETADIPGSTLKRPYEMPSNPYVDNEEAARYLAELMLKRLRTARESFPLKVVGNPARRPGQRVRVTAPVADSGTTVSTDCYIRGLDWSLDKGGYSMDLDLVSADIYTGDGWFIWNKSKYGGVGTAGSGKVWY